MDLKNKKGLIMGVANDKSIAWGIAQQCAKYGADLAFTYQNEMLLKRLEPLAKSVGSDTLIHCEADKDGSIQETFKQIEEKWGRLDFFVHGVAFADKNELRGKYVMTSKENFLNSLNISCYSFTESCKYCYDLMDEGGSIITLTYYGAEQVMPHYNVMGVAKSALEASVKYLAVDMGDKNIRVNAISAGPIKTLAASGIGDFRFILRWNELNAPLKRNVSQEEVGTTGVYLLSDLSSGVTGEIHHVDCGYHTVGMVAVDEAQNVANLLEEFSNKK
jgi:enoyl-[acyl-carrier protein] reductase I